MDEILRLLEMVESNDFTCEAGDLQQCHEWMLIKDLINKKIRDGE